MALVAVFFWYFGFCELRENLPNFAILQNRAKSQNMTFLQKMAILQNRAKSQNMEILKKNNWEFHNFAILQKTRNLQNSLKKMGISIWPVTQKIGTFANYIIRFFPILKFRNFDIFLVPGSINWP